GTAPVGAVNPSASIYPVFTRHFASRTFSSNCFIAAAAISGEGRVFSCFSVFPTPRRSVEYFTISSQWSGLGNATNEELASIFLYGQKHHPMLCFSSISRKPRTHASSFSPDSPSQIGTWYLSRKAV